MRSIFLNAVLFVLLSIAFSSLTGCGTSPTAGNAPAPVNASPSSSPSAEKTPAAPSSAYPMLRDDIAAADIDMLDGKKQKISDLRGKVVLINLWATWCTPCRAEMPELIQLQDKYRDQGFEILGLDVGDADTSEPEPHDQIASFVKKMELNYQIGSIDSAMSSRFQRIANFSGIPQSFLIDREGHLRGVFTGGGPNVIAKLKTTVADVVGEK